MVCCRMPRCISIVGGTQERSVELSRRIEVEVGVEVVLIVVVLVTPSRSRVIGIIIAISVLLRKVMGRLEPEVDWDWGMTVTVG